MTAAEIRSRDVIVRRGYVHRLLRPSPRRRGVRFVVADGGAEMFVMSEANMESARGRYGTRHAVISVDGFAVRAGQRLVAIDEHAADGWFATVGQADSMGDREVIVRVEELFDD